MSLLLALSLKYDTCDRARVHPTRWKNEMPWFRNVIPCYSINSGGNYTRPENIRNFLTVRGDERRRRWRNNVMHVEMTSIGAATPGAVSRYGLRA